MVGGKTAYQLPELLSQTLLLTLCQKFLISSPPPPPSLALHDLLPCQTGLSKFKFDYHYSAPMTLFTLNKSVVLFIGNTGSFSQDGKSMGSFEGAAVAQGTARTTVGSFCLYDLVVVQCAKALHMS